jgi:hypothetical protein
MTRWSRQLVIALSFLLCLPGAAFSAVGDPSMNSTSYSVIESELGGSGCDPVISGSFCGSSTNYQTGPDNTEGGSTLGEAAVGNSSSTDYQTNAGYNTTQSPGLMICVGTSGTTCATMSGSSVGFGLLSTTNYKTATAYFGVRDYTSYGYVVQVIGATPSYNGHNLTAMTTNAQGDASQVGTEQFGLNLVANTSPTSFGANPICQASGFCSGVAGDGSTGTYGSTRPYTVDGRYRYVSGETVASGPQSSGETDYTVSFLANQSLGTPSGLYTGGLDIVATGRY